MSGSEIYSRTRISGANKSSTVCVGLPEKGELGPLLEILLEGGTWKA